MRYHLERKIEEYVASGMPAEEAQQAAMRAMEGVEQQKEKCRDMRRVNLVEDFWQDLRYGARMLRRTPGFTAIVILTLALGIGANTAIFSVIDAILLRPLPFADAGSLVIVWETNAQTASTHNTVSPPNFLDWESQNRVFSGMSYVSDLGRNLTGNGEPEQVIVQYVSVNFFSVLGVSPIIGPGFAPENGLEGKDSVVVLGYELWKRRFGSDSAIIGKTIDLNGKAQTVVGIAPKNFGFFVKQGTLTGNKPQLWSPWALPAEFREHKPVGRFMTVVARLKPGVTPKQAQTEVSTIAARLEQQYPDYDGHWGVNVVPLRQQISGELRPALLILLGAVTFVLLVACANVSSLLLARAAGREREMGIRTANGAPTADRKRAASGIGRRHRHRSGCMGNERAVGRKPRESARYAKRSDRLARPGFRVRNHFDCRPAVRILAVLYFGARGHRGSLEGRRPGRISRSPSRHAAQRVGGGADQSRVGLTCWLGLADSQLPSLGFRGSRF